MFSSPTTGSTEYKECFLDPCQPQGSSTTSSVTEIDHITTGGRPNSTVYVRSFLQVANYNARYTLDHKEDCTYEEVTKQLGELLVKDVIFKWRATRKTI